MLMRVLRPPVPSPRLGGLRELDELGYHVQRQIEAPAAGLSLEEAAARPPGVADRAAEGGVPGRLRLVFVDGVCRTCATTAHAGQEPSAARRRRAWARIGATP
jgi:hypothetical protein